MATHPDDLRMEPTPTSRLAEALATLAAVAPPNREEWVRAEFPGDPATQRELLTLVAQLSPLRPEEGRTDAPADEDPWTGRSVAGCTIGSLLGRGGMGRVYQARQQATNRLVAVKLLGGGAMPGFLAERLRAEGAALGALAHHNIARVYQAGVVVLEGRASPFVVMELVPGARTVGQWAEATRLGARDRIERVARCCDAVQHAHARGIIHGDIKPTNVLFGPDDEPKLIDFGTARIAGTTDRATAGMHAISPAWAAPEQAAGGQPSASTLADVYGLGRIAGAALAGPVMHGLAGRQRRDLAAVIARATAVRPEDRHPTADALAVELREVAGDRPVRSRRSSPAERAARIARRHPVAVAAVAVAVAALTASGIAMFRADRAMRRAYAISQLSQATVALDGGNREAAVTHARSARSVGALPDLLPRMIERQADMTCGRVAVEGGDLHLDGAMTETKVFVAGRTGVLQLPADLSQQPRWLTRRPSAVVASCRAGQTIVVAEMRGNIVVIDPRGGPERTIATLPSAPRSIAVLDGGRAVLGGRDGALSSVELDSGSIRLIEHPRATRTEDNGPLVTPIGGSKALVACFDGALYELDVDRETPLQIIDAARLTASAIATDASGSSFAFGGWIPPTRDAAIVVGRLPPVRTEARFTTGIPGKRVCCAAMSSEGGTIGIGLGDGALCVLSTSMIDAGPRLIPLGSNRQVTWCAFDRTDTWLVAAVGDCVVRAPVRPTYGPAGTLGFAPRGSAATASQIVAWDNEGNACTFDPRTGGSAPRPAGAGPLAAGSGSMTPDGKLLAGWQDGHVLIDGDGRERRPALPGTGERARTAWSADGQSLWAIRGRDAWVLDRNGSVLASGMLPTEPILPTLLARAEGQAIIIDGERSWKLTRTGSGLVAEDLGIRGIRAWDAGKGILVTSRTGSVTWTVPEDPDEATTREFGDPSHAAITAAYSEEQGLVAVGCSDQKVRVWDFRTGEQLVTLGGIGRGPPAVHWLEEGRVLVAIDLDGAVRTWTDLPVESAGDGTPADGVSGASG